MFMCRSFKDVSEQEILQAIEEAEYLSDVLHEINCIDNGYNRKKLKEFIESHNISTSHIRVKLTREKYEENPKCCKQCGKIIPYDKRENDFCNHSCAASYNNKVQQKEISHCLYCNKEIPKGNKFCNTTCQREYNYHQYIDRWLSGEETGIIGENDISNHIRRYLFELHNNSCEQCGWNQVNKYTNKVPLQIHHIDGNCKNNNFKNLQLLCPNCHSLTENFGARNKNCTRKDQRIR